MIIILLILGLTLLMLGLRSVVINGERSGKDNKARCLT